MKFQAGDKVKITRKMHPWRQSTKKNYYGCIGVVLERKFVTKSKEVPNGVIIIVGIGKNKVHFPTKYLTKVLTNTTEDVRDIL